MTLVKIIISDCLIFRVRFVIKCKIRKATERKSTETKYGKKPAIGVCNQQNLDTKDIGR